MPSKQIKDKERQGMTVKERKNKENDNKKAQINRYHTYKHKNILDLQTNFEIQYN